jgi:RNA polymerase sigma factor (sigma-70 family)
LTTPLTPDRQALAAAHLRTADVAAALACRRLPRRVRYDDVRAAARFGLVQAAASYDPARGVPFATYAQARCRGAVADYLREADPLSRRARGGRKAGGAVADHVQAADAAFASGLDRESWEHWRQSRRDTQAAQRAADALADACGGLLPRSRRLVELLAAGLKQCEAAEVLGVCQPRVSQMVPGVFGHLRRRLSAAARPPGEV